MPSPGWKASPAGMASTASADTPKVAAFTKKASAGEPSNSRTPPSAGPAMSAALEMADRVAFAPGRSASGTSRGVTAETAGRYGAAAMVAAAAISGARPDVPTERRPGPIGPSAAAA